MRIHMSGVSKALLDKVGGFRCEYNTISGIIILYPASGVSIAGFWTSG